MTTLTNIYSREKTLFYFTMWNDSDRKGYSDYLGYTVKNNLFIVKPAGQKGSVWYDPNELAEIEQKTKTMVSDQSFIASLKSRLDEEWTILFPYLNKEKVISSGEELEYYYTHLVNWWSAMNTAFGIPDMMEADETTKQLFLSYRTESEKYTEQMNKVFIQFWNEKLPQYADVTFFVSPSEAVKIANGDVDLIEEVVKRKNGCVFLNEKLYPIDQLDAILGQNNLTLEKIEADGASEIKGSVAYKIDHVVAGKARLISGFKDMHDFQEGEILVTEMTNPDYVPVMKLAAAIVTNEGGITCHAAIASRELKVPCVIGTKVATNVIKTGDMVEVDTLNGIIRII